MERDIEKEIRENWFEDHIATLSTHGGLEVLKWKEPGTSTYLCRYVFDNNKIYISGDIGEAIFELTWKAGIHTFNDINLGYFYSKLSAYSEDKKDFSSENAVKRLREWLNDLKDEGTKYDHDEMKELFESARNCNSTDEWAHIINDTDFISDLEPDYWEWMYNCGDEIPMRIRGYLIGLKMASEQLKKEEVAKEEPT